MNPRGLWWTGVVMALMPGLGYMVRQHTGLTLPAWAGLPIVVGPVPVADPLMAAAVLCELASLGLLIAATVARRRTRAPAITETEGDALTDAPSPTPGARQPADGRPTIVRVGAIAVTVLAVLVMLPTTALVLFAQALDTPALVGGASPSGCRVLVVDHTFLLLGSGDVYAVPPGPVAVARPAGGYVTDDGYSPVAMGTVSVTWEGDDASVNVWSNDGNRPAAWSGTVSCG
jgi:hypothetical protein